MDDRRTERERMVEEQIRRRGVADERVLDALVKLPRHEFVPPAESKRAYEDHPLPIGGGQTISQPYMVAAMTELLGLGGRERVLEIGTGSGYQTAVLAALAKRVFTIEKRSELAAHARSILTRMGLTNVDYRVADGSRGWPEEAPFDGILLTAAAPDAPEALVAQLADGGTLVAPLGARGVQELTTMKKTGTRIERRVHFRCSFVPLLGVEGFRD